MNIKFILLLAAPMLAFGAGSGSGEYDIIPRVINFVIFFAILYYLIAKPVKAAYHGRINAIANRLNAIQEKLKASNAKKEEAAKRQSLTFPLTRFSHFLLQSYFVGNKSHKFRICRLPFPIAYRIPK